MKNTHLLNPNLKKISFLFIIFCISITNAYYNNGDIGRNPQSVTYNYNRIEEVKKKCASVLDSAPKLKPDDNRIYRIKEELSFVNGDWWQYIDNNNKNINNNNNKSPLMPFDARDISMNTSSSAFPLSKLASFWVTDVARSHSSNKYVSVSGIVELAITLGVLDQKPFDEMPRFDIWPGQSQLTVIFQGIYTENGGERVMCLLGEAKLPSRNPESSDPWEWVKKSGYSNQPPLLQDEQILLIINYPKTFSLTNRAINGSMKSLNPKSNLKYFDEVYISSSFGASASYDFRSETVSSEDCSPSYKDTEDIDVYKGFDLCLILQRMARGDGITILPNWRCNGTDEFCSKLGPFSSDNLINATDIKLLLQDVRCNIENSKNNKYSKVSLVFRVVDPLENSYTGGRRTGLNNMTLSAEGEWNYTSGKLCMIGCLGLSNDCNSHIVIYIPLLFSIKQRSIITGVISSIIKNNSSYFPLSFGMLVRPSELWDQYTAARPYYKYSKIKPAAAVLERDEPFSVSTKIKKSFLQYPKVENIEPFSISLSYLAEDLTLHTSAYPDLVTLSHLSTTEVQLEIVSLGNLFGRYWSSENNTNSNFETPFKTQSEYTEKQLLLNVSAQLTLTNRSESKVSIIFLEGIYDEHVGKMYLIACVNVRASPKVLFDSMDLENGLDCLAEAIITYPPTTARWLVNPTATISLSSQRNEDDPLYFKPINLQTFPLMYRRQREDILSRRGVEGILRIFTLSVTIACILSQILCIKENLDSVPFISLVTLGVQALGYSLPLITGAEAIFKKMGSESYDNQSYNLDKNQWIQVIDYTVKILVLISFLITIRLCQKVWKSRIRLLTRAPLEPHRVPSDKLVLVITSVIHIIGYIIVVFIHYVRTSQKPLKTQTFVDFTGNSQTVREWETELEEYVGLIQDIFLLPQIIGNFIWQIDNKPLRKFYFMGLTSVRVLPHIYDFIKVPIANPYFSEEYEFVNPRYDFYSKFGDVAIPVTAIILAVVVYAQQRWKYDKLRETIVIGNRRLLPLGSKVYERLPSQSFEAELVSGVNDDATHEKDDDSD